MSRQVVVVEPGQGDRVGNVEFLARTVDTPFFNLSSVVLAPGQGVERHTHEAEDDSWLVLDGTLSVTVGADARRIEAGPGTFVLVPAGTAHELRNDTRTDVRFLNVHAPGGFDRRIGWRPRRCRGAVAATLSLLAVLLLTAGGPASAAGLPKAKVQQIAAKVVQQQAPKLSVAHASTATSAQTASRADRATVAGDAEKLGGRAPETYLDRAGFGQGPGTYVGDAFVALTPPVTVDVPAGVNHVHVTGNTSYTGGNTTTTLHVARGASCPGPVDYDTYSHGSSQPTVQNVTWDRLLPVTKGPQTFVLCGWAVSTAFATNPTLVVETVAGGAS